MKKITSKNEMILACATLVLLLFVFSPAMGDPQLSVAVSSSTPSVVYLADGAETVTVTLTATPTLTNNAGELIEHEEGDCGTTDYIYEWSPTPNISTGNGATYTLDEGIHVFNVTVTAINLCVAQIGGGNAIVEVKKKCEEKRSRTTTKTTVIMPAWTSLKNSLENLMTSIPIISNASLVGNASASLEKGEMCCQGENNEYAEPVKYDKYSGSASVGANVTFNIPGWAASKSEAGENPVPWTVNLSYSLGPTITVGPTATISISGTDSPCGKCLTLEGNVNLILTAQAGATGKGSFTLFEDGHWLAINGEINVTLSAYAQTSAGFNGKYKIGNTAECTPDGFCNPSYYIGAINLGVIAYASVLNHTISFNFDYPAYPGINGPVN